MATLDTVLDVEVNTWLPSILSSRAYSDDKPFTTPVITLWARDTKGDTQRQGYLPSVLLGMSGILGWQC